MGMADEGGNHCRVRLPLALSCDFCLMSDQIAWYSTLDPFHLFQSAGHQEHQSAFPTGWMVRIGCVLKEGESLNFIE